MVVLFIVLKEDNINQNMLKHSKQPLKSPKKLFNKKYIILSLDGTKIKAKKNINTISKLCYWVQPKNNIQRNKQKKYIKL